MDRKTEILAGVTKLQRGIEIGAWMAPLAPTSEGYDCLSMDVFDTPTLRRRAAADPNIGEDRASRIQDVDLVGSATEIEAIVGAAGALGTFDYVISSHNFEHLPNPIKFLRGCGAVLKPGGLLSMAIPDKRTSFDYFRPYSTLAGWVQAYWDDRSRPTLEQVFDLEYLHCRYHAGDARLLGFSLADDPRNIAPLDGFEGAFERWRRRREAGDASYHDVHCSVFTPSSFELLVSDSYVLGLSPLKLAAVSPNNGAEFYARLVNVGYCRDAAAELAVYSPHRRELCHAILAECAQNVAPLRAPD